MSTPVGVQGTLVTLAPTGAESAEADVPALPVTVDEVVSTARDCQAMGAGVPGGTPGTTAALAVRLPFLPPGATFAASGVGGTAGLASPSPVPPVPVEVPR